MVIDGVNRFPAQPPASRQTTHNTWKSSISLWKFPSRSQKPHRESPDFAKPAKSALFLQHFGCCARNPPMYAESAPTEISIENLENKFPKGALRARHI
jgi:hypothetical protein